MVVCRARDVDGARGGKRDEHVLVDRQLAAWIATWDRETTLLKIIDLFQYPGSFPVVLGTGILILLVDRSARRKMLRLGAALVTAELVTGILKAIFSRQRPFEFNPGDVIGSSFPGLFHSLTQDNPGMPLLERSLGGFPSGHVTCAGSVETELVHGQD